MPFPPPRVHAITRAAAAVMTRRHRDAGGTGTHLGFMFPRDVYERLLAQPGCAGIRAYAALDEKGERQTVLVGVDKKGDDMMDGLLFDLSFPCPPYCGGGGGGGGDGLAG